MKARRALLLVAAATALTAALGGLARLGLSVAWGPRHAMDHGPLFVLGVFGTVISLERAVALGARWSLVAPGAAASAAIAMLGASPWAPEASVLSALALASVNVAIVRRQPAPFTWVMLLGSLMLLVGSARWARGAPVFAVVPTWATFFVLTIAAERLELSRFAPTPRWASRAFVALALALAALALVAAPERVAASRAMGASMSLVGAWQMRFDLARRTLRLRGLPRFAAVGVLLGAAWLIAGGALLARAGMTVAGPAHDAALHAVFVGYVLSMVFAHAPIILPAVARVRVPFSAWLYLPLGVLHVGLLARVAGDLGGDTAARQIGAVANALSLALLPAAVLLSRRLEPGVDTREGQA